MKRTILPADRSAPWPEAGIPAGSRLVLDFGAAPYARDAVAAWEGAGYQIDAVLGRAADLADPVVASFMGIGRHAVVTLVACPGTAEAVRSGRSLASPDLVLELPVETVDDCAALKILSSLGVRTRVKVEALRSAGEPMLELLTDTLIRPGKRTTVSPFDELRQRFLDDEFSLAELDYRANDAFVDLRGGPPAGGEAAWRRPSVRAKRVSYLLERHPCTLCEGFGFCQTYLLAPGAGEGCKELFSEFMVVHDLALARQEATQGGTAKGGCAC